MNGSGAADSNSERRTDRRRRRWTLLFLLGALGVAAELALLEHWEDRWQWAPFVALAVAAGCAVLRLVRVSRSTRRALGAAACLLIAVGIVGVAKHFQGNLEFELEIYPELAGPRLWWEALRGATPALAPAFVSFLGLLGVLASTDS